MTLNYRTLFILVMMVFGLLFFGFYSVTYYFQGNMDVKKISEYNLQKKTAERIEIVEFFNSRFPISLNAIEENPDFQTYLKNNQNNVQDRQVVENLFLSVQKSTHCAVQVRFLNMQGDELIRTEGIGNHTLLKPLSYRIVPKDELQHKTHRPYFQEFKFLKEGEIGISNIELNMENRQIVEPKQPVVRYAKVIYQNGQPKGVLIINICLTTFFEKFVDTAFYNIYLIDENGHFILYKEPQKSLTGDDFQTFSVYDAFGFQAAKSILSNSTFLNHNLYSVPMNGFSENQNLKLILELKFKERAIQAKHNTDLMLLLIVITILAMLPVAIYLSRFPDKLMKQLDDQVHRDELTNLPNKNSLFEDLQETQNRTLILLRIDNLREINNVYGYMLASELLTELGKKLDHMANDMHFDAYKLPSNLFALSVQTCDRNRLEQLMHVVHRQIEHENFSIMENHEFSLSITLGASNPENPTRLDEMLIDAEKAMRFAVDTKVEYSILDDHLDYKAQYKQNIYILELIRAALLNDRVKTFFQPIYNNHTQRIDKYEVLMRLVDEKGVVYPPNTFLDIAKASKYYHRLTRSMVQQSVAFFKDKNYEFSINISSVDIMNEGFMNFLIGTIKHSGNSQRMVIEIVETEGLGDYEQVSDFIHSIKMTGCKIAIDDFGTGYSNFEHLLHLRNDIDYIKIDGTLVRDLVNSEINRTIVKNIKTFCDDLGIQTIAEFVADQPTQEVVQELGIDYSQGYYFGQPQNELLKSNLDST